MLICLIYKDMTLENFKDYKKLEDGQVYIYVIANSDDYVKIGETTDPYQRFSSLSGSNGGGSKIDFSRCYVSPSTYLSSIERICHMHFDKYRIPKTEWFKGLDYDDVVEFVSALFSSADFKKCNETRRILHERM